MISDLQAHSKLSVFSEKNRGKSIDALQIYNATGKLQIVNITLDRQYDDPQLIFESLNSTGVDLPQPDLIRNCILMGLPLDKQKEVYAKY